MKLRKKTFLALTAMIVLMGFSVFVTIRFFYDSSVSAIERGEAEDAVRSLDLLIADDLHQLDILCRDWAYWDDSYEFALGTKNDYLAANLEGDQTIELLELSSMLISDANQNRLYQHEEKPGLTDLILSALAAEKRATNGPGASGFIILDNEVHLVSINPILKSDRSGPPQGIIAMARRVDAGRAERYARILGRSVSIGPALEASGYRTGSVDRVTFEMDDKLSKTSLDITTLDGQGAVRLTLASPTVSARYGTKRFLALSIIILAIITVTGTLIVLLLEGTLLGRMRSIGKDLDRLAATKNRKQRITVAGNDELSALCAAMNGSLDRLDSMIDEREAMLHEINHRVKNNLQVINSMLSLQASSAKSPETIAALDRSRHRLQAIAIVHDEALEHANIERIDLLDLIQRISSSLTNTESVGPRPELCLEGDAVEVVMDLALPLALISGEVIHNALAHAFTSANLTAGLIMARVIAKDGPSIVLEIRDNGVGIQAADAREHGLGLTLVEALVLQLRGRFSIKVAPEGGTVFILEAPLS